jgi:hypothetical protein
LNRERILLTLAIAVLLLFGVGVYVYDRVEEHRLGELAGQSNSIFNRPHSPTYGSAQAKVRIVEFFDPACETCRAFYPLVKDLVDSHPGKVQLMFNSSFDTHRSTLVPTRPSKFLRQPDSKTFFGR